MKPVKNEKAIGSLYHTSLKEAIKVIMSGEQSADSKAEL